MCARGDAILTKPGLNNVVENVEGNLPVPQVCTLNREHADSQHDHLGWSIQQISILLALATLGCANFIVLPGNNMAAE